MARRKLDPTPFACDFVIMRTPTRLPDFAIPYLSGTYRLMIGACEPLTHPIHRYTALISTANLSIQFGAKPLFENVSVTFGNGNRYGLIGANGSGKSTLMKILAGELEPTAGNVSTDPKVRIGQLSQDQFAYENYRVLDAVIMGYEKLWQVMQERNRLYSLPEMSDEDGMRVAELEIEFAEMDGYSAESRAGELLEGIGIPVEQHKGPMSAIAPGWKLRVLLAQALYSDPDILLLDEPTNNLDINAIRWLEGFLETSKSTMVIISHDRHFLNSVCSHMADLDYGKLHVFPGNYDEYMTAATQARERVHADNAKKKVRIAELQTFVSRFSANASKARQATSRARQLEKIQLEDIKPSSRVSPFIRFEQEKPLRRFAVQATNIGKGFDEGPLFTNLDLAIEAGSRVAIIGPNGIGKTTLVRCLLKELEVNNGKINWAENARTGYFPQDIAAEFDQDMTLFDWITQWQPPNTVEQLLRATLGRMLFSRDDSEKSVKVVSGGEQRRLMFGKLILQKPNVMVMDEPTNHLDMESIEALNLALENYPGTLIFISHDRDFVSSLATRIIEMTPDGIIDYTGTYDEYLRAKMMNQKARVA
ncbi:putative transporter fused subunits of ABC superfamily: ATP-binding components [uncultured Woeseiaceae bacterium]|uniref:Probable ATP-binding protein YbiT n=2 Tax=root TaxID=1 RepID=A0A7D9D2J5_9GAMM|nr:putative transporter fused subunits of ABC superfamily: ATP-binding components [uncultured Woeseiaceae bacterium]